MQVREWQHASKQEDDLEKGEADDQKVLETK